MKKYFRVGQTVYDVRYGHGIVEHIDPDAHLCPLYVGFKSLMLLKSYTLDGKDRATDLHPSLYQNPIVTIPNDPFEEFESGELVWVNNDVKIWEIRFYSHFEDGEHHCFKAQQTEGLTNVWKHVRKFNDNPLTK